MKKTCLLFTLVALFSLYGSAQQKFAFVDTEYILSSIPTYEAAQTQLDELADKWQKEIEAIYKNVEENYKKYQAERVMLSEEMRKKREEDIVKQEKEAKELQKKYFGKEGELYKKRQELVKPIQDEVYNAVKDIATEGNYTVIFDTAAGPTILYYDSKYDKSDDVLKKLGYNN